MKRRAESRKSLGEGLELRKNRKLKAAASHFRTLVDQEPDNAQAWYYLAVTLDNRGQEAEAIPCYRKAIRLDPMLPTAFEAWLYLASSLRKTGKLTQASRALQRAKAFDKPDALIGRIEKQLARAKKKQTF